MRKNSKRKIAATIAITAILVGGGGAAAIAYWSSGGSGIGSATTGTNSGVTAVQTSTVASIVPGLAAQTLAGNFTNPNSSPTYVTSVTASIASVTKSGTAPAGTCDATDYTIANALMTVGAEVATGSAKGAWTGATIAFNDKVAVNQDACKGATVNLSYAVN